MTVNSEVQKRLETHLETKVHVSNWLNAEDAFVYTEDTQSSPLRLRVDFLVVHPIPFAVEIVIPEELPDSLPQKAKQLLAKRLTVAERFGAYVPLIAVVPETAKSISTQDMPLIDGLFNVNQLPHILELPNLVKLDWATLEMLKQGDPGDVHLLGDQEFNKMWANALTLQEIVESPGFATDTLAEHFRKLALEEQLDSSVDDLAARRSFIGEADGILQQLIAQRLSGQFVSWRVPLLPTVSQSFEVTGWQAPNGQYFVVRLLAVDPLKSNDLQNEYQALLEEGPSYPEPSEDPELAQDDERAEAEVEKRLFEEEQLRYQAEGDHQKRLAEVEYEKLLLEEEYHQLLAESWMIRAHSPIHVSGLLVVLGATRTQQIKTLFESKEKQLITRDLVNAMESTGWTVTPWDFSQPEPACIRQLQIWSKSK